MTQGSTPNRNDVAWVQLPCVCANLRRLTRLATRLYDDELRSLGIESGQFTLTATIARLGPITQAQLARGLAMDQTSLTRTLALLQRRGWIDQRVGADRRSRLFDVTRAGLEEVERARPHWQRAQQRLVAAMGSEQVDVLRHIVHNASLALRADAATVELTKANVRSESRRSGRRRAGLSRGAGR